MYQDEDIDSDEEPDIQVRNSVVNTMNNVQVSHERESFKKSRNSITTPSNRRKKSDSGSSESDDDSDAYSYGDEPASNKKFEVNHIRHSDNEESSAQEGELEESGEEADNNQDVITVDEPLQLVKISSDLTTFEVCQEALDVLKSIKGNIGVVSVAGAQRTGKSFVLNMLLDKLGGKGFRVSPSTAS